MAYGAKKLGSVTGGMAKKRMGRKKRGAGTPKISGGLKPVRGKKKGASPRSRIAKARAGGNSRAAYKGARALRNSR